MARNARELICASLAVSDGDILIRTDKNLACIGETNGISKIPPGRTRLGVADGMVLRALLLTLSGAESL